MSWVTVIWSMVASSCLTLAALHGLVWLRQRESPGSVLFFLSSLGTAGAAACELWLMRAASPAEYGLILRWMHVPVWVVMLSLVAFVQWQLKAGRLWLAWLACGVRTLAVVLNFAFTPNINFQEITGLRPLRFLGETIVVPVGVPSPWMLLSQAALVFMLAYLADAIAAIWRRGDRRRAVLVGGSMLLFVILSTVQVVVALWGIFPTPVTPSLFFLGVLAAMAFELSGELVRARQLSSDLAETEHRLSLSAEAAHVGIWVRDFTKNSIWASDKWRSLFGFESRLPLTMDLILERIHPDDRPHVMQTLQAATERGGVYDTQYRILLPADGQRWISSHGSVERDENGRARLLRGVSLDITQRMRTEQELLERRSELAHLSRVTMLGELSGSLAHELNQPLTAILSNAQAAQRFLQRPQPDLGEVAEILDDIVEADKRAGEVIRRMRDLMTKGEMQVQLLDINRLIQDVLKVIRVDLANRQVTVHTQLSLEIPLAKGDGVQLQQVLMNLLLNAADAMHDLPPGERRITVSTRRHERGGVQVCVDDSGAGVPESQWEEIFTAFHTTKPGGMGLGLAVSRTIVHAHGGTLSVRNLPAGGASFCFELPSVSPGTA